MGLSRDSRSLTIGMERLSLAVRACYSAALAFNISSSSTSAPTCLIYTQTLSLIKQTIHPTPSPISLPRLCPQPGVPSQVHYSLRFLIHNFLDLLWFPNEQWQHLPEHANTALYTASVTLIVFTSRLIQKCFLSLYCVPLMIFVPLMILFFLF